MSIPEIWGSHWIVIGVAGISTYLGLPTSKSLVGGLEHFYTFFIFPYIGKNDPSIYIYMHITYLVGGLEHEFYDFHILGIIIPTDELIFFKGVGQPPTRSIFRWSNPNIQFGGDISFVATPKKNQKGRIC